jgi:6-phosphogluconolactonase
MIEIFPTPEVLADAAARHIVACAADAISLRGRFTLVLAGGSTPRAAYWRLATGDWRLELDWGLVHLLWGDERCVPPDDPRSNYRMVKEVLLDRVPIPPQQIHRIRGEDEPDKAAAEYEREIRRLLCHPERIEGPDLVLLGLGKDGHTASLFPGQPAVHETERWVVAVPGPSGGPWRVTLTPAVLNRARNVTFVVSGGAKAPALEQVLEEPFAPDLLPAQAIYPAQGLLMWMLDETAAGQLRPKWRRSDKAVRARTPRPEA